MRLVESLLGCLFDARALFSIAQYTGIALPTAAALWWIAVGSLLAQPEVGLMRRINRHLVKPVNPEALMTLIAEVRGSTGRGSPRAASAKLEQPESA